MVPEDWITPTTEVLLLDNSAALARPGPACRDCGVAPATHDAMRFVSRNLAGVAAPGSRWNGRERPAPPRIRVEQPLDRTLLEHSIYCLLMC